jgi:hypothetical protein
MPASGCRLSNAIEKKMRQRAAYPLSDFGEEYVSKIA